MHDRSCLQKRVGPQTANYGDTDFALYLRCSFGKSMGYSQAMLDRPVVGIVDTGSAYNNCHRTVPALIEPGEARRAGRRRYTDAVPDGVPMRAVAVSDVHALSEPGGTGTEAMLTAQPLAIGPRQGGATRARCLRRSRCPGRGIPSFNRIERIPPVRVSRGFQVRFPCVRHFALLIWISSKSNTAIAERNGEETSVYRGIAIIFFNVALLSGAIVLLNACNTTAGIGQDVSAAGHAVTNTC